MASITVDGTTYDDVTEISITDLATSFRQGNTVYVMPVE